MSNPVTFRMPDGTQVSNDPRFHASKLARQMESQQAALGSQSSNEGSQGADEKENEEGAEVVTSDYSSFSSAELKSEAKERGLDTQGLTKKSQLIALLEEADAGDDEEDED